MCVLLEYRGFFCVRASARERACVRVLEYRGFFWVRECARVPFNLVCACACLCTHLCLSLCLCLCLCLPPLPF